MLSVSVNQKSEHGIVQLVFCLEFHKTQIKVLAGLQSCLEALQMNHFSSPFRLLEEICSMQLEDSSLCVLADCLPGAILSVQRPPVFLG